jgi:soluble lytic murein transglycosylase
MATLNKSTILTGLLVVMTIQVNPSAEDASASAATNQRIKHAKELMGSRFSNSMVQRVAQKSEKIGSVESFVYRETAIALPAKFKSRAKEIAKTILTESSRAGFDPLFLMAVIQNESSFKPEVRGTSGEIGLMQILPNTAKWAAKRARIAYHGDRTLRDPVQNIRIGTAYMLHLQNQFDSHSRLYLAAYNMGAKNVRRALANETWPAIYPQRVMKRYVGFYQNLDLHNGRTLASN